MKKLAEPSGYKGRIRIPASKSHLQRALALAFLSDSPSRFTHVSWCNDTVSVRKVIEQMGAQVLENKDAVDLFPGRHSVNNLRLNVGESGLAIRMLSPVAALNDFPVTIEGGGSLKTRPMGLIKEALEQLNVSVKLNDVLLPIQLLGPMQGSEIRIDGSLSSQLLTGLLIALPKAGRKSIVHVENLKSKPYIDMTLRLVEQFGGRIEHSNYKEFVIEGNQQYTGRELVIEGDWSAAAFHLVAAAIAGEVEIFGLQEDSCQADKAILTVLEEAGADFSWKDGSLRLRKNHLNAFQIDATDCPDLFPSLVVLASACKGLSKIKGISRLAHKESDRGQVLAKEFGKLGLEIEFQEDEMLIEGKALTGGQVDAHNDHRIAMAGAIAGLIAASPVEITGAESVNKSYPAFFNDFYSLKK